MNPTTRKVLKILLALLLSAGLVIALIYARQRLFARTEPIILSS